MKFNCPSCGKRLTAADSAAGRKGICPQCRAPLLAPEPPENQPWPASHETPATPEAAFKPEINHGNRKYVDISQTDIWSYFNHYIQNVLLKPRPDEMMIKHVGFWWRCFQYLIDLVPILFFLALMARPLERLLLAVENTGLALTVKIILTLLLLALLLLYWTLMESSQFQGSLGKILLDFKVVNLSYQPIPFETAVVRNLLKLAQFIPPFTLLFLYIMYHPGKQGVHDRLANTLVILNSPGIIWYYERRWLVLWFFLFLPFGLLIFLS